MSGKIIQKALRQKITEEAKHRCGYCLTSEFVVGAPMELDHIIPQSLVLARQAWVIVGWHPPA